MSSVSWRDGDAPRLGSRGVTPFGGHPVAIPLVTPVDGVPTAASLSTGSNVLADDEYNDVDANLVDMEFAVVGACQRFDVPVFGLRGVSDGPGKSRGMSEWTDPWDCSTHGWRERST